jgi:glycosyltransferase involved in cell wall biosynthesis
MPVEPRFSSAPAGEAPASGSSPAGLRRLSILVPVFNEAATLPALMDRLLSVEFPLEREIVLVNDGSTDTTRQLLESYRGTGGVVIHHQAQNRGKAAAIRAAVQRATGDVMVIQDADLEYDPAQLPALLQPILEGGAQVVYGSRFKSGTGFRRNASGMSLHHTLGNRSLTFITNLLFGTRLTDMETCYKMAVARVFRGFVIERQKFELEPEITAKIIRQGYSILEVPITFAARGKAEGKKISWRDGFGALWTLLRYRFGPTRWRDVVPLQLPETR